MSERKRSMQDIILSKELDRAAAMAVREAIIDHKRAGNPICEWRDGKVVWIQPEDIKIPELPPE